MISWRGANRDAGVADLPKRKTDSPHAAGSGVLRIGECFGTPGVYLQRPISGRIF
jgi:hypothetical protein